MRNFLLPAVTALAIGLAGTAMAGGSLTTTGAIKSIDTNAHSVTLADGTHYTLPSSVKIKDLKVGDKVSLTYTQKGEVRGVSKVTTLTPTKATAKPATPKAGTTQASTTQASTTQAGAQAASQGAKPAKTEKPAKSAGTSTTTPPKLPTDAQSN